MKNFYIGAMAGVSLLAFAGAVLALVGQDSLAIAVIGFAIAITPALHHLRMRRMLAALRNVTGSQFQNAPAIMGGIESQVRAMEKVSESFSKDVAELSRNAGTKTAISEESLAQAITDIRREARMVRLISSKLALRQDEL
ncbi:hypothetical protein [Corynebacterium sp. H130]|uniref:hypothetical protein n=1 Tax=Corynebacterium sp. H130 TaxID=3133444 RepID=UPI0030A7BF03